MTPTVLGLVVIVLGLAAAARPAALVALVLVAGIFDAAAALVLGGGFGVPVALVPALLLAGYVAGQYALGLRMPGEELVLRALLPLLLLAAWAVLSALVLPDAFAGRIMVWPNRPDPIAPAAVPLQPGSGNTTQTLYIVTNAGVALLAALFLTRASIPWARLIDAYLLAGYAVVVLCFWNLAARLGGVWFPAELLYSNPNWAIVEQWLGPVPRIQGPFAEPAALAVHLSGLCLSCLALAIAGWRRFRPLLLLLLTIACMLLSTSTTGIVVLTLGLPLMLLAAAGAADPARLGAIARTMGLLLAASGAAVLVLLLAMPGLLDLAALVLDDTLGKTESDSFIARAEADRLAIEAMVASGGLGVGWGSTRSSSLVPGLLGNGGVPGLLLALLLGWNVVRLAARAPGPPDHPARFAIAGFGAALCGQLAAALVSAPTITSLTFFVQVAIVVGAAARLRLDAAAWRRVAWARGAPSVTLR
jgi:hypothetical protein